MRKLSINGASGPDRFHHRLRLLIRTVVTTVCIVYVDWLGSAELEACSRYASTRT